MMIFFIHTAQQLPAQDNLTQHEPARLSGDFIPPVLAQSCFIVQHNQQVQWTENVTLGQLISVHYGQKAFLISP